MQGFCTLPACENTTNITTNYIALPKSEELTLQKIFLWEVPSVNESSGLLIQSIKWVWKFIA